VIAVAAVATFLHNSFHSNNTQFVHITVPANIQNVANARLTFYDAEEHEEKKDIVSPSQKLNEEEDKKDEPSPIKN
jgi:hypothetical protein